MKNEKYDAENDVRAVGAAFLGGVLMGAVLGGVAALLLTPRSGRELRGQLSESAKDMKGKARRSYEQAAGKATVMAERGRRAGERALQVVQNLRDEATRDEPQPVEAETPTGTE